MKFLRIAKWVVKWAAMTVIGVFIGITVLGLSGWQPLIFNNTKSLPTGLYFHSPESIRRGALVCFPMPPALLEYLSGFSGKDFPEFRKAAEFYALPTSCLIKPVVALAGDTICRNATGVFSVNGRDLGTAPASGPDQRPLPSWAPSGGGCRRLGEGELAVFSDRLADSLDSRFFGAIPAATAKVSRPLWTK